MSTLRKQKIVVSVRRRIKALRVKSQYDGISRREKDELRELRTLLEDVEGQMVRERAKEASRSDDDDGANED